MQLTFASCNIRKAIGPDRRRDPDRILTILREIDADIIPLREADRRFGRRASVLPPSAIAFRLVPIVELRPRRSGSADGRFQRMGAAPRVLPRIRQRMASAGTGQELSDPKARGRSRPDRGIQRMAGHRNQGPSQRTCRKKLRSLSCHGNAAAAQFLSSLLTARARPLLRCTISRGAMAEFQA